MNIVSDQSYSKLFAYFFLNKTKSELYYIILLHKKVVFCVYFSFIFYKSITYI